MKDVVFFTPNPGMESAVEFISTALNCGGPPRFNTVDFKLLSEDPGKCATMYDTKYKASNENLLSIETMQVCGDEETLFFLRVTIRTESLRGSIKSHTMVRIPDKEIRFPEITSAWQKAMAKNLGHRTSQDLWDHLLNVEKIRRMPL